MTSIAVSGSLAYDRIMSFPGRFSDHLIADKLHTINVSFLVDALEEQFGGTAGNIAYNLSLLGEKPHIFSTAGRDFTMYDTWLRNNGIDTTSIHRNPIVLTASAHIMTDKGNNQISAFYPGAANASYGEPDIIPDFGIIAAGGVDDMVRFPFWYRSKSVPFFYDPGQQIAVLSQKNLRDGITGADCVFVNDYEFSMIEAKTGWSKKDIITKANQLVVTLGAEGSRIISARGEERVPAVHVDHVKDPTGAGDAYRAGFIKGVALGAGSVVCARLGSVTASFAIEYVGTQKHHFTPEDIKERYMKTYDEALVLVL